MCTLSLLKTWVLLRQSSLTFNYYVFPGLNKSNIREREEYEKTERTEITTKIEPKPYRSEFVTTKTDPKPYRSESIATKIEPEPYCSVSEKKTSRGDNQDRNQINDKIRYNFCRDLNPASCSPLTFFIGFSFCVINQQLKQNKIILDCYCWIRYYTELQLSVDNTL